MTERDVPEELLQAYRDAWPQRTGEDAGPFLALVGSRGLTDDVPAPVLDVCVGWWRDGVPPHRIQQVASRWALSTAWSLVKDLWSVGREVSFQPRELDLPDDRWFVSFGDPDDPEAFDRVDRDGLDVVDAVVEPNEGAAAVEARLRRTRASDGVHSCSAWFAARQEPGALDVMVRHTCVGRVAVPREVWDSIHRMQTGDGLWSDGHVSLAEGPGTSFQAQATYRTS